jgi:hypothetical protein
MNKNDILEWVKVEKQISFLKNKKEILKNKIIKNLTETKLIKSKILLPEYNIKCVSVIEKETISKKYLLLHLNKYFKNTEKTNEVVGYLYNQRNNKEKIIIRKYKK